MKNTAKGYPITGFNDTLFKVYSKLGSFSAKDRADAISIRIENLPIIIVLRLIPKLLSLKQQST
jgi:hypothetical protein